MNTSKPNNNRYLTILIVVFSVIGIFYFGYQAIIETNRSNQDNPFEYDIEHFKAAADSLFHYEQVQQIGIGLNNVFAITLDPQNRLFVSGDQIIQQLGTKGNIMNTISVGQPVRALFIDGNLKLYAATDNRIQVYDSTGLEIMQWKIPSDDPLITSIVVLAKKVFVADANGKMVWCFDSSGNVLFKIDAASKPKEVPAFVIPSPYFDLGIDPDGFLWVVNPGNHLLENYTPDGSYRTSWGIFSMSIEGFCGCCNPGHIAILNDGSFVTSEKGIPRVKIYNRLGQLVSVVAGPEQFAESTAGMDLAVDRDDRIFVLDPVRKSIRIFKKSIPEQNQEVM